MWTVTESVRYREEERERKHEQKVQEKEQQTILTITATTIRPRKGRAQWWKVEEQRKKEMQRQIRQDRQWKANNLLSSSDLMISSSTKITQRNFTEDKINRETDTTGPPMEGQELTVFQWLNDLLVNQDQAAGVPLLTHGPQVGPVVIREHHVRWDAVGTGHGCTEHWGTEPTNQVRVPHQPYPRFFHQIFSRCPLMGIVIVGGKFH